MKKLVSAFITIALSTMISACAGGARHEQMVVTNIPKANFGPYTNKIMVENVGGGKDTNPLWMSKVSNEDFKIALEDSLKANGLLNTSSPAYKLSVQLTDLSQPLMGLDMDVNATAIYTLKSSNTGQIMYNKTIQSGYTATVSDAFVGSTRMKLANEGAIRTNISQFINSLKTN